MLWGEEREESWPQCGADRCGLSLRSSGPGVSRACVGASTRGAVERAAGAAGRDLRIQASVLGTGEVIFQNVKI